MTAPGPLLAHWDPRTATATSWGSVSWLVNGATVAGAEQTLGVVTIEPGQSNPLHFHPNCEEILYVVSGQCEHRVGDQKVDLGPGMCICIPRGAPHCARTTSSERLVVVVSFSSPDRQVVNLEGGDLA
ncbi:MAG TPA: cupin domain-containing protein [Acidimicrobiales bacterium]|nr:cupin domain-containing protein [Acidimicrobiales bacterium]